MATCALVGKAKNIAGKARKQCRQDKEAMQAMQCGAVLKGPQAPAQGLDTW